jgi:ferredoxin
MEGKRYAFGANRPNQGSDYPLKGGWGQLQPLRYLVHGDQESSESAERVSALDVHGGDPSFRLGSPGRRFGQSNSKQMLQLFPSLCGRCGGCVAVCPAAALQLRSDGLKIEHPACTLCDNCIVLCPNGALYKTAGAGQAPLSSRTRVSDSDNG